MRTVRCSSRLLGGVCPGEGRVSARGMSAQGGVCQGVSAQEGGVCPGGVYPSMHWGRHPPCRDRMIDRCKNITFPQHRLRMVITEPIPMTSIFYRHWKRMWTCGPRTYFAQIEPISMTVSGLNPGICLNVTGFNNLTDTVTVTLHLNVSPERADQSQV